MLAGCADDSTVRPAGGAVATAVSPQTASLDYWIDQPASSFVASPDYNLLWAACDAAARDYLFAIDRTDYRQGVLTTKPLISKHWAEVWRRDVTRGEDVAQSSLATYRRTIRYELRKNKDDQAYEARVKVVIERSSTFERRVTTAIQFRDAFGAYPTGTEFVADDGTQLPSQYWYAVGRDEDLEKALAETVREKLVR